MNCDFQESPILSFRVEGVAQSRGSKVAVPFGKRFGLKDSNPKSKPWMNYVSEIAAHAKQAAGLPLLDEPLVLRCTFFKPRPKGHFNAKGALKPSAPEYPTTKPDAGKLMRAVEDALTKVVYRDDSVLVDSWARKRFAEESYTLVEVFAVKSTAEMQLKVVA